MKNIELGIIVPICNVENYSSWQKNFKSEKKETIVFPTSGADVLYSSSSLHKDVKCQGLFTKLCTSSGDIWLFWMSQLNKRSIISPKGKFNLMKWLGSGENGLTLGHVNKNGNSLQIARLQKYYSFINEIINLC